jgi:hypothetical protein
MQIGSSSLYDTGFKYSIKLNEKEVLIVEEDPASRSSFEAQKKAKEQEKELKKAEEVQKKNDPNILNEGEKQLVKDLSTRDSEVKAHEAAHQGASGGLAGAASYTYQQGPDGKMYAIGGEVPISSPTASSPEEALENAKKVVAAALAAGSPSPQDYSVAASASVMQMQAQEALNKETQGKKEGIEIYKNTLQTDNYTKDKEKEIGLDISA